VGRPGLTGTDWDTTWRRRLVDAAGVLVGQLAEVGLTEVYLDGSFVENKDHPGDIDGYFLCPWQKQASGDLERELNLLDPHSAWTWSRSSRRLYAGKSRLPMWIIYRVELYPHLVGWPTKQMTGIKDQFGNDLEFPSAFRQSRNQCLPKGIVRIRL
jgi:hypothetical protein